MILKEMTEKLQKRKFNKERKKDADDYGKRRMKEKTKRRDILLQAEKKTKEKESNTFKEIRKK